MINQPQDALQGPVDTEETMKDFCSKTCLSCFNYKKIMATRIPIMPVASQSECSICSRYCIVRDEGTINYKNDLRRNELSRFL